MSDPRWMTYDQAHRWEAEAARLGVSEVARSRRGFMRAYQRHGTAAAMRKAPHPTRDHSWAVERAHFVKRHMAQYRSHPTRRRWLALVMWAYRPSAEPPPDRL